MNDIEIRLETATCARYERKRNEASDWQVRGGETGQKVQRNGDGGTMGGLSPTGGSNSQLYLRRHRTEKTPRRGTGPNPTDPPGSDPSGLTRTQDLCGAETCENDGSAPIPVFGNPRAVATDRNPGYRTMNVPCAPNLRKDEENATLVTKTRTPRREAENGRQPNIYRLRQ